MLRLDAAYTPLASSGWLGADHRDPRLAWLVPASLSVAKSEDGTPSFTLFRHAGAYDMGGNLLVRLVPSTASAAAGREVRTVPFRSFAARIRVSDDTGTQVSAWREGRVTPAGDVVLGASFSAHEMDAIWPALDASPSPIDVEAAFTYAGIYPGLPFVATVKVAALVDRLRSALPGSSPLPASALAATAVSLLALDASLITTTRTDDRAAPAEMTALLTEAVARLLPTITTVNAGTGPDAAATLTLSTTAAPDSLDVDLSSPRLDVRAGAASWSVGDFLGGLDAAARTRALPTLTNADVLSRISVQMMTSAPFDARFLARVDVGLRYRDVAGKLQQTSSSLSAAVRTAATDIVRNVLSPLTIERRITAVIDPNGVPLVVQQPYAPVGPVIDLAADDLGLRFVVATADPEIFSNVASLTLTFRAAPDAKSQSLIAVTLDATRPACTLVIPGMQPGMPLWANVRAVPPPGTAGVPAAGVVVADRAVDGRIDVAGADVIPQAPQAISIARAPSATTARYSSIVVTARAAGNAEVLFKLGEAPRTFNLFATSPFSLGQFDYKVDWVDTTKGFDVISGAFHSVATTRLLVDPESEPRA